MERATIKLLVTVLVLGCALGVSGSIIEYRGADAASYLGATESIRASDLSEAVPNTPVMLLPTHTYVEPSEVCTLQVWVGGSGDSLACVECWVSFDTTLVDLIHAEEGELFQSAPFQRLFFWREIAPDTQSVEGCLLHYTAYTLTPGELARYVFEAKQPGVCPVKITRMNLFDKARTMYQPIVDPAAWIIIGTSTGVEPPAVDRGVLRAVPNPFNPTTTLILRVAGDVQAGGDARANIAIYSTSGTKIRELFDGKIFPGENRICWDGTNGWGERVASGVYFAVAKTPSAIYRTKLVLVQ